MDGATSAAWVAAIVAAVAVCFSVWQAISTHIQARGVRSQLAEAEATRHAADLDAERRAAQLVVDMHRPVVMAWELFMSAYETRNGRGLDEFQQLLPVGAAWRAALDATPSIVQDPEIRDALANVDRLKDSAKDALISLRDMRPGRLRRTRVKQLASLRKCIDDLNKAHGLLQHAIWRKFDKAAPAP